MAHPLLMRANAPRRVPQEIKLEGGSLRWHYADYESAKPASEERLLHEFLDLSNPGATPEDLGNRVLIFAKTYGVLELCRHGDLTHHLLAGNGHCPATRVEPVSQWQKWARKARALWQCTETVKRGKRLHPEEGAAPWAEIGLIPEWEEEDRDGAEWARRSLLQTPVGNLKRAVALRITVWFREAGVWPVVEWGDPESSPRLRTAGTSVFAAVLTQLTTVLATSDHFVLCAGCGQAFMPSRTPRSSEKSWCTDCREAGLDKRAARRAYRARKNQGLARESPD